MISEAEKGSSSSSIVRLSTTLENVAKGLIW